MESRSLNKIFVWQQQQNLVMVCDLTVNSAKKLVFAQRPSVLVQ